MRHVVVLGIGRNVLALGLVALALVAFDQDQHEAGVGLLAAALFGIGPVQEMIKKRLDKSR